MRLPPPKEDQRDISISELVDEDIKELLDKELKKIIIKLFKNNQEQMQGFKAYVAQEIPATLK